MTKQKPTCSGQTVVIVAIVVLVAIVLCVLLSRTMLQLNQTGSELTAMTADRDSTAQELSAAQSLLAETDASLTEAKAKLAETEGKLTEAEAKLSETEGKLTEAEAKLADTEAKLTETETALATATAAQETAAAALVQSEAQLTACQTALTEAESKLAETEGKLSETEAKLADSEAKLSETEDALTGARNALSETQTILAAMTAEKEAAAAALADRETALSDAQAALAAMTAEKEAAAAALTDKEAALQTANEEINNLKNAQTSVPVVVDEPETIAAPTSDYVVEKEIEWEISSLHKLALVIRNTSGESKAVSALVMFYDETGNVIGVAKPEQYVCGSGEEAFLACDCSSAYASYEYIIEFTDTKNISFNSDISIATVSSSNNVILTVSNNGTDTPEYITYHCLFLNEDGKVVKADQGFLDVPSPGKTTMGEIRSFEPFNSFVIYYSAFSFDRQ